MKTLEEYENLLQKADKDLNMTGMTIQEACMIHPSQQLFYYDKWAELKHISEILKIEIDKLKSLHVKHYNEKHSISLQLQVISKYIESEPDVINARQKWAEVDELATKFQGIKEAFISRGYQLNNVTKQRVAQIEEGLL